jgi:hypothetical protein
MINKKSQEDYKPEFRLFSRSRCLILQVVEHHLVFLPREQIAVA